MRRCSDQVREELTDAEAIAADISVLLGNAREGQPNNATMAAIAMYMVNLYRSIEKILELISHELKVPLPKGGDWHSQLLAQFSEPPTGDLPLLVTDDIAEALKAYRGFRSVVQNAYAMRLRWDALQPNAQLASVILTGFRRNLEEFLAK
jgi:hypothetical protein